MTYLLEMGFWTDLMVAQLQGPDVFFTTFTVDIGEDPITPMMDAANDLLWSCHDKYGRDPHHADTFWSCAPGDGVQPA